MTTVKIKSQEIGKLEGKRENEGTKNAEEKELLRQQSSMWISEDLDKKILEAIVNTTPL